MWEVQNEERAWIDARLLLIDKKKRLSYKSVIWLLDDLFICYKP